jgi:large subunit ribosomal protein L24
MIMMKAFSKHWKSSSKAAKQRKYQLNAPLHTKRKMIKSMLSPDLKAEYGYNSATVRVGDTVKVLRGTNKGKTAKVTGFSLKDKTKAYLEGFDVTRIDGSIKKVPFHHSNLMIMIMQKDKKRLVVKDKPSKKKNESSKEAKKEPKKEKKKEAKKEPSKNVTAEKETKKETKAQSKKDDNKDQ